MKKKILFDFGFLNEIMKNVWDFELYKLNKCYFNKFCNK